MVHQSMKLASRRQRVQDSSLRSSADERRRAKQQQLQHPVKTHGRGSGHNSETVEVERRKTPYPPPPPPPPPTAPPTNTWRAFFASEHGQHYYHNAKSGETTWKPPPHLHGICRALAQPCTTNQDIADRRGIVTVRSRSAVFLSKGGHIQRAGGPISTCPVAVQPAPNRGYHEPQTASKSVRCEMAVKKSVDDGPSMQSTLHRASARAVRRLQGTFTTTDNNEEWESRARQMPVRNGPETPQCDKRPVLERRQRTETCPGETGTPLSTLPGSGNQFRRRKVDEIEGSPDATSDAPQASRAASVAASLLQAEEWLMKNEGEIGVKQQLRRKVLGQAERDQTSGACPRTTSCKSKVCRDDQVESNFARPERARMPTELKGATARLRGKAAAELAAIEMQRKEEEEMTGKPEITRLGRSKQRSVDDLFLFQRTVEASQRHKRDERDLREESLITGRPETCSRSTSLVNRMRRDGRSVRLPISERLHGHALEQRRRREILQTRVETAIRRRANPRIFARSRSRSLPQRNREEVARRLYKQALLSREEALERVRLAQRPPSCFTFRPEIDQRSGVLAQRRRERWASLGLDVSGRGGASAVQEVLQAEGELYQRRRQERQSRQEQLAMKRQSPTVNERSRRLLRDAERMGRSIRALSDSARENAKSQEVDDDFCPRLEALNTSKRMLESRYGRDSIPSMEARAKERDLERLERKTKSEEQDKENRIFVARRIMRSSSHSESPEHLGNPDGAVADIYERTTAFVRKKESRWASEREALLAQELAACTFAPELPTKRRGRTRHQAAVNTAAGGHPSPLPARLSGKSEHKTAGLADGGSAEQPAGAAGGPQRWFGTGRHQQPTVVRTGGWLSSSPSEATPEKGRQPAASTEFGGSGCSVGSGEILTGSGVMQRRGNGRRSREERRSRCWLAEDRGSVKRDGEEGRTANEGVRQMEGYDDSEAEDLPLPRGWTAFTSPEGWEYFFNAETSTVQWERPTC